MPSSSWATPAFLRALRQNRTDILSIPRICTQPLYYESIYYCLYPQAESNRYQKLRRFLFFRLNYGNVMVAPIRVERMPYDLQSYAQLPTYATRPLMFVPRPGVEPGKPGLLSQYVCQFHQQGIK